MGGSWCLAFFTNFRCCCCWLFFFVSCARSSYEANAMWYGVHVVSGLRLRSVSRYLQSFSTFICKLFFSSSFQRQRVTYAGACVYVPYSRRRANYIFYEVFFSHFFPRAFVCWTHNFSFCHEAVKKKRERENKESHIKSLYIFNLHASYKSDFHTRGLNFVHVQYKYKPFHIDVRSSAIRFVSRSLPHSLAPVHNVFCCVVYCFSRAGLSMCLCDRSSAPQNQVQHFNASNASNAFFIMFVNKNYFI